MPAGRDNADSMKAKLKVDELQDLKSYIEDLDLQVKDLWARYVDCVQRQSQSEIANVLNSKYFDQYKNYRANKKWNKAS